MKEKIFQKLVEKLWNDSKSYALLSENIVNAEDWNDVSWNANCIIQEKKKIVKQLKKSIAKISYKIYKNFVVSSCYFRTFSTIFSIKFVKPGYGDVLVYIRRNNTEIILNLVVNTYCKKAEVIFVSLPTKIQPQKFSFRKPKDKLWILDK